MVGGNFFERAWWDYLVSNCLLSLLISCQIGSSLSECMDIPNPATNSFCFVFIIIASQNP